MKDGGPAFPSGERLTVVDASTPKRDVLSIPLQSREKMAEREEVTRVTRTKYRTFARRYIGVGSMN